MWKLWKPVVLCACISLAVIGHVAAQTYVQSKTNALGSGGNNAATFANAPTSGNTVVAGLVCYGPSNCTVNSITDNFGNTYSQIGATASYGGPTQNITNVTLYCSSGISTGSNFTVSASLSNTGGDSNLYIAEYSGASCNVDQSASGSLTDGTATTLLQTASTPTTTNAADLLVAVGGAFAGGTATAGTSFSLRQNGSGVAEFGGYEDRVVTATGAYSASMNLTSTTTYWAMVMVALKGSSGTAPTVTSFTPTSGPAGTSVTLTGTNFTGATAVKFNGTAATTFTVNSATQITATVPTGATTGTISVTTSAGTGTSSSSFTVTTSGGGPIAYVQSQTAALSTGGNLSVTFATAPTGGNTIVVGSACYGPSNCTISSITDNYSNTYTKIGPTASFGGPTNITNATLYCATGIATGSSFTVTSNQSNSGGDSNLYIAEYSGASCNVDQSASGSLTDGTATNTLQTAATPTTTNAADLLVAVGAAYQGGTATAGTGFSLRQNGSSTAEFGGYEDRIVSATGAYTGSMTLASTTTYWAMTMVALKGSTTGGGTPPVITSISTTSGQVYTVVTITGTNLGGAPAAASFNGQEAGNSGRFGTQSDTTLTVWVPFGATSGPVTVSTASGTSNGIPFTVTPGPAIGNMPGWGTVGAPITITGSGFGTTQGTVSFNGLSASVSAWSATSITAVVPLSTTRGGVTVTAGGVTSLITPGTTDCRTLTIFCPGPLITSISPSAGPAGTTVTITGVRLDPTSQVQFGDSTVTFNGTVGAQEGLGDPLTGATSWGDGQIVLPVPSGATNGPVVVGVRVQGTGYTGSLVPGAYSNPIQFNVGTLPSITSLSAVGGSGGSTLTLTGSFGATQGTVIFQNADIGGNTNASITSWSASSIVITVPSTLPIGEFNVQVTNSAGPSNTEPFWITGAGCPTTW